MKKILSITNSILLFQSVFAQEKPDKAIFTENEAGYYQNSILKDVRHINETLTKKEKSLRFEMDQSSYNAPNKVSDYTRVWANPVVSQGNAGTCWAFSTTSFLES